MKEAAYLTSFFGSGGSTLSTWGPDQGPQPGPRQQVQAETEAVLSLNIRGRGVGKRCYVELMTSPSGRITTWSHSPLWLFGKTMPPARENHMSFEKQLLA